MTRCVRVRVCDTVDVRLRLGLPTRAVSSAPVCTGVAPAKRPRALNTLTSHHMASGSSAEPLSLSVFLSYVDSLFTCGNSDLPARPLTTQIGTA